MDPKKDIFATTKGRWDFIIAVIVIALFSIFIYQFISNSEEKEIVLENEITETENSKAKDSLYLDTKIYQPIEVRIEDAYDANTTDKAIVIADYKPVLPMVNTTTKVETDSVLQTTQKEKIISITEENIEKGVDSIAVLAVTKEDTPITKELEVPEIKSEKVIPIETVETTNTEDFDCIIIVGVFKNPENKKSVIEKLKSLGYTNSEGILAEGKNYVGVPVACNQKEKKQQLLKELNHHFGIHSWVKKK